MVFLQLSFRSTTVGQAGCGEGGELPGTILNLSTRFYQVLVSL